MVNMTLVWHRYDIDLVCIINEVSVLFRLSYLFVYDQNLSLIFMFVLHKHIYIYIYICLFSLFLSKYTKYMFVVEAEIMASNVFFSKIRGDIVFVLKRDSIMGCKIHPPDHDDLSWDPTPLQGGLRQMCDNSQLIYKN